MEKGTQAILKFACLVLLLGATAWAQPASSDTSDPSIRHASETDKAPIFGYMINARSGEMRGNSLRSIYRQCLPPTLFCAILMPIYFRLSRRRTPRPGV